MVVVAMMAVMKVGVVVVVEETGVRQRWPYNGGEGGDNRHGGVSGGS